MRASSARLGDTLAGEMEIAIAPGVEFDDRRPEGAGDVELARVGLDEQRDADAAAAERRDHRRKALATGDHVEAALRRALLALLRNDAGGVRANLEGDRHHLVGRGHLEIERQRDVGGEPLDIAGHGCGGDPRADAR